MPNASTYDRILDALERILLRTGSAQVTLEAVANEADVSKGGLLYHFPSKDALLIGLASRLGDRADAQLSAALAAGSSIAEFYLQSPDTTAETELQVYRSLIAALHTVDGQNHQLRDAVTKVLRGWDEQLRAEIPDPVQAEIVRLAGDGIYLSALLGLPLPDPDVHRLVVERLTQTGSAS
ncbi:TetR/AcrR family transcriptional regulator [Hoyosella subflava]|uniref:Putative transcriptional regulator, TetR family protein n=1 Tax=Hoyosella subflava (strain DSM 45089 / JCM 17490 / NBRC 109087 / DQS3-9A1) TaxID=443218 RepID=F6EGA7_HOYSD|nr:TetR/AcrR family transcriptional regulator [Hoyosella subflava]AEF39832.1 putative transcriptional regulator, TetR family protein [Hoyosella subflava DQS3-9A1]